MDTLIQKFPSNTWKTVATISAAGALAKLVHMSIMRSGNQKSIPDKWTNVSQIKKLIIYPVKSCRGIEVDSAELTPLGLKASKYLRDRAFMIVTSKGVFQTQRQHPTLAKVNVEVNGDNLTFSGPDVEPITINMTSIELSQPRTTRIWFDHLKAVDCGDAIGKWFDNYLSQDGLRLLYHVSTEGQRKKTSSSNCTEFPHFTTKDLGTFQDDTAYMLMAEESVAYLNTKIENPVTFQNFRPVILLEGQREPFAEDFWTYLRVGDRESGPVLKITHPCARCRITTIDQNKGVFDAAGQPLKDLFTLKRRIGDPKTNELVKEKAIIGANFGLFEGNGLTINVGDAVYAALL